MIEISFSGFFVLIFCGTVILAVVASAWDRHVVRRAARAVRRNTIRCRICGATFRWEGGERLQACPECGRLNQAGRDRRLG